MPASCRCGTDVVLRWSRDGREMVARWSRDDRVGNPKETEKRVAKYVVFVAMKQMWHVLQHYYLRICAKMCTFAHRLTNYFVS